MRYTKVCQNKHFHTPKPASYPRSKVASGQSYSVTLPIEFVRHLKWKERQKLNITLEGNTLIIKDWKK